MKILHNFWIFTILIIGCSSNNDSTKSINTIDSDSVMSVQKEEEKKPFVHPKSKEHPTALKFSRVVTNFGNQGKSNKKKHGKIFVEDGNLIVKIENEEPVSRTLTSIGFGTPLENGKYSYKYILYYMGTITLTEFVDAEGNTYKYKFLLKNGWTEEFYAK